MRIVFQLANLFLVLTFLPDRSSAGEAFLTYRSSDGGRSWEKSGKGLPRAARVNAFGSIETTALAATDHGIFLSVDQGRNWAPAESTNTARTLCFASLGDTVFVGTERIGLLASRDAGKTWHAITPDLQRLTIRSLVSSENTLLAGTDREGVFRSTDGKTWNAVSEGLPAQAQVHQLAIVGKTIFAALYSKGLYRRGISEGQWQRAGEVVPLVLTAQNGALIAGHNPGGIHWSTDRGENWKSAESAISLAFPSNLAEAGTLPKNAPIWSMASNSQHAFAGAADGIFYSADHGRSWTRAVTGLPPKSPGVAFLADERFVLATIVVKE